MTYRLSHLFIFVVLFVGFPPSAAGLGCAKLADAQLAFMLSPLSEKIVDVTGKRLNIARGETYTEENLLWAFGLPHTIDSKANESQRDGRYVIRTWHFEGLAITAELYDQYWVSEVTVQSPKIELECGLRIGQSLSDFVAYLGEPKGEKSGVFEFSLEYPQGYHPVYRRSVSARIWLTVRNGRVEALRWVPGPGH